VEGKVKSSLSGSTRQSILERSFAKKMDTRIPVSA